MKTLLSVLSMFLVLALIGCQQPTAEVPKPQPVGKPNVHVMNSKWYVVKEATVEARALQSLAVLQEEIDAYNDLHTDDQLFLVEGEEPPPIELSPTANMWMVHPVTYAVVDQALDIPRELVREHWLDWKAGVALQGLVLFIDRVPPPPIPDPDPPTDYEKYAVYLIDQNNVIQFETHCENWEEMGFANRGQMFWAYSEAVKGEAAKNPGWFYVIGQLWEPPVEEPEEPETPTP